MPTETIEGYRLSPQQKHLCSLQQIDRNTPYRVQVAVLIEGRLNAALLKEALERVIARHESLRTNFQCFAGLTLPVQVVGENGMRWMAPHDLSGLDANEQQARIEVLFEEAKATVFELENGPLLHASLIMLSSSQNVLLLGLPAVSSDLAGLRNLVREVRCSYESCLSGEELLDEPAQYADISEYLNELLESEETESGRRYWRSLNIAEFQELRLPFEGQYADQSEFDPKVFTLTINPQLTVKVEEAAKRHETTASVFLLTCWQVVLWRLTGQQEIVIGTAFSGRKVAGLDELPGLFEKYLPLLGQLEGHLRFDEALRSAHESVLQLAEWQDYFNWDQWSASSGDAREPRFFPVSFDSADEPTRLTDGNPDLSVSIVKQYACIDRFKIRLSVLRQADSLSAELHYDSQLFSRADVESLAELFQTLVESASENSDGSIAELEILSDAERHHLVVEFNQTKVDYSEHECVHRQIEEQTARTPDSLAVEFNEQHLTFDELNNRANQLARHLRGLGIGPDVPVGICMERAPELVIAILGILKAGGAYLPLDPSYPAERLAFILNDAQIPVVLTQQRLLTKLPKHEEHLVCLDTEWHVIAEEPTHNPTWEVRGDNLGYIIYTSGSTGQPKGVMIPHRGLANYLNWSTWAYRVADGSGAPVHSSIGFDLTITSLFPPLIAGKRVVLVDEAGAMEALSESLRQGEDFSLVKITPAHVEVLSQLMEGDELKRAAKALVIGGEALSAESLAHWRRHAPHTRIINEYGPTEAVVGCCVYEVTGQLSGAIPIGRPIANAQIYLLDEQMRPVPVNVAGEIYIGGAGLARGYLNRPDLTAERFLPNSFDPQPGKRLYKTGDLARHRADGNLEFLGRRDHQVKIRSYRIELGEIEAVLNQHSDVREAVVVLREETGEKRLAAYVVANEAVELNASELRGHLQQKLPEYMLPSAFVLMKKMPLTSNGKVDRRALPAPDTAGPDLEKSYVSPRTPVEDLLARLWAKALGVRRVGIHDNFFELGGDSIVSIQIASRANKAGVRFAPRQIFQHRTIAELATVLETTTAIKSEQGLITGPIPLTPIQHWLFEQDLPEVDHWNQAVMFDLRQPLDSSILEKALQQLLFHHDALRSRFIQGPSGWQQLGARPVPARLLTEVNFSGTPEEYQEKIIQEFATELQASINLSEGELVRAALIHLGSHKPDRFLWVIHHLAVDIVSWGTLLEGLQVGYSQLSKGESIQLALKTTSYKEWGERLTEYAQSSKLGRELGYWLAEPRRRPDRIPVDYAEGANVEGSVRTVSVTLSVEETKLLMREIPKAYRTMINDVLLTALVQGFARWSGSRSLLVDLENHGREEIFEDVDLLHTVGWFTCIFPLLLDVRDARDPGVALKLIKDQIRHVPDGGIGYGVLRYLSQDPETRNRLRALPQAEVSFNYVGRSNQSFTETSLFAAAGGPVGASHSLKSPRRYVLEVTGGINQGQLRMAWLYSENLHERATIERFADGFVEALRSIIDHCLSPEAGGHTPSDFLVADMDQRELDQLMTELSEIEV